MTVYKSNSPLSKNIKRKDRNDHRHVPACQSSSRRSRKSTCLGHSSILTLTTSDDCSKRSGLYKGERLEVPSRGAERSEEEAS